MKIMTMLCILNAAALMACDSPTTPDPPVPQDRGNADLLDSADPTATIQVRQAQTATGSGELVPITFAVEQVSHGINFPIGWCNEAAGVVRASAPGTGKGTHVGRFEMAQTLCLNTVTGAVTDGFATVISANGDEVYYTFEGEAVVGSSPPMHHLTYTVVGGTGRFASAEGELDCWPVHVTPTAWTDTGTGWLRYAPSGRSER